MLILAKALHLLSGALRMLIAHNIIRICRDNPRLSAKLNSAGEKNRLEVWREPAGFYVEERPFRAA